MSNNQPIFVDDENEFLEQSFVSEDAPDMNITPAPLAVLPELLLPARDNLSVKTEDEDEDQDMELRSRRCPSRDPGIQFLGSNSRDIHVKDVRVRDRNDATTWSLSTRQVPNICSPEAEFTRGFMAHDITNGAYVYKEANTRVFDMFVEFLHNWAIAGPPKIDAYELLDWVRLWILGERLGAPLVKNFAMKQMFAVTCERVDEYEDEDFKDEVMFLWAERRKGDRLRQYFLNVFRCAGLCEEEILQKHDKSFIIEVCNNMQTGEKGGQGKSGLKAKMNVSQYYEKIPARRNGR